MTFAVDTNILVRYLTWDDPAQATAAAALLEADAPLWISTVVLCETVWVLRRGHKYTADEIILAIQGLVAPQYIRVEDEEAMNAGFEALRKGADFADGCILNISQRAGARPLITFDQKLGRAGGSSVRLLASA